MSGSMEVISIRCFSIEYQVSRRGHFKKNDISPWAKVIVSSIVSSILLTDQKPIADEYMSNDQTATWILDATYALFFEGKVSDICITEIAKKAQLSEKEVTIIYPTLNDITKTLSERSIAKLKKEGLALAQNTGINVLRQLISNDLLFFYRVEVDRNQLTPETLEGHTSALGNFDRYFNSEMPLVYATFFKNNKDLLPHFEIDIKFYAYFVSHSLKFFNFRTLKTFESTSEGRKLVTEQIIGSLFDRESIELNQF
jgi:hypothetical protein